jgi:hypothetical protein
MYAKKHINNITFSLLISLQVDSGWPGIVTYRSYKGGENGRRPPGATGANHVEATRQEPIAVREKAILA